MQFKTIKLSPESQADYDEFLREREAAKAANSHDEKRKAALKRVIAAMGEFDYARLPDGRVIYKHLKERNVSAKPASKQSWFELQEITT